MARKTQKKGIEATGEYDDPQVVEEDEENGVDDEDQVEMLAPPEGEETDEGMAEAAEHDEAVHSEATPEILEAKSAIEDAMMSKGENAGVSTFDVDGGDMIQGVGLGAPELDVEQIGEEGPGAVALNVYTAERIGNEDTRRHLFDDFGVQAAADDDLPLNIFHTGFIDAEAHRHKQRPSPNGISAGHFRITAGTQGALARGRRAPRDRRLLMLSNNHVLANSNGGRFGDSILQPGRVDGGQNTRDRVAILERYVPIRWNGPVNYVDCATGWCWPSRVRKEFIYRTSAGFRLFRVSSQITLPRRGMVVGKTGRTTQLRAGRVTGTSESIWVNFGGGRRAFFRDQMAVRGLGGRPFSAGGDSGSLIWTWDRYRRPVGLLFAGGGGTTFGNKIWRVLNALDIRLVT